MERWYEKAVIYAVDIKKYYDHDNDGSGDLKGLIDKLDYLSELGINCIWLLPFFPSPMKDNGYDISDYYGVRKDLGTMGDFVSLVKAMRVRGMNLIIDLVVNHSSDEHPWFQASREKNTPRYKDYYIWTKKKPEEDEGAVAFPGVEKSLWKYDSKAEAYYYHTFYDFQPDLNLTNPEVMQEIRQIIDFWVQLGVSGFRIDATGKMTENKGKENHKDPHAILKDMYNSASWSKGDVAFFAEADVGPHEMLAYFSEGKEMQVLFNFIFNAYLFYALAKEEAEPLAQGIGLIPELPAKCQWANFLRNLDELNIERLPETGRNIVFERFAPEEKARIYGRGIRRRLRPMLEDERRIRLAYSLMFSMPGTPVIVYGDEIGMGDDLSLEERNSVRTSMQWSPDKNGGFSRVEKKNLRVPTIDKGKYGFKNVNVEDQYHDPDSLLNWLKKAIRVRKAAADVINGKLEIKKSGNKHVLAHMSIKGDNRILFVHNLSGKDIELDIEDMELEEFKVEDSSEFFGDSKYDEGSGLKLGPYGFRWFGVNLKDG